MKRQNGLMDLSMEYISKSERNIINDNGTRNATLSTAISSYTMNMYIEQLILLQEQLIKEQKETNKLLKKLIENK